MPTSVASARPIESLAVEARRLDLSTGQRQNLEQLFGLEARGLVRLTSVRAAVGRLHPFTVLAHALPLCITRVPGADGGLRRAPWPLVFPTDRSRRCPARA